MKRFLFAPLALAALCLSTVAASAAPAPRPPHHLSPREQARWEAEHRPTPRPAHRYQRSEPLPTHRVARVPLAPVPAGHYHR